MLAEYKLEAYWLIQLAWLLLPLHTRMRRGRGRSCGHDIGTDLIFRQHSVESSTERSGSLRRLNSLDKGAGSNSNYVAKPVGDKLIEVEKAETGSVS